ncbi:arylsulfatase [Leucobacter luti]|uniref:Arylsulfatase n=1 Tax=Leucobacter luti TaxID=340320 RepID=A0A4Q7U4N7_9MICO|nr:arylsulfatase [Leucobacter luti]MBL3700505.1 arylsulfatase [Leucobacter luti]RZT68661.1 arylsulfatase [Leucobacter luti]
MPGQHVEPETRTILPVPDRPAIGFTAYDAKDPDYSAPPITRLRPPVGAPNVIIALLDDVGFGASSAFGGPVQMPTAERLAGEGLRYSRFHTAALCAPTRAALLSGRNHHSVGMGNITEMATGAPGYNGVRSNAKATLPEILRLNGYATAQFGKCHEVPPWETSAVGPFDRWPTHSGFEHFYGFVAGETHQYYPALYHGTTPVEPAKTPEEGYHLTEDLADHAINWIRQSSALQADRPFFMYWAPGATHAPHHAPKEWADKYRGQFDQGWDAMREQTITRQRELGVISAETELTGRPVEIPSWDETDEQLKPLLRRQMEVYAGFLEHTDHHFGRVIDAVDELGLLENTLVLYIIGDNGASAEGTLRGSFNEGINFNGMGHLETDEFLMEHIDDLGTPAAYNHYAVGWAHAMSTPYQWTKQVASHFGGTRNGTIAHWPQGITDAGEIRNQFTHVIDVAATVLDIANLPEPVQVHGVTQSPMEGRSFAATFGDADAQEHRQTQYFEMFGNRGIYHRGWTAVTKHRTPWELVGAQTVAFDDDLWELYDTATDWSQANDLSQDYPEKLHELQRLWLIEATKFNVLPLDDRGTERMDALVAGRPQLITGNTQILFPGMGHLTENTMVNVKNRSHSVTAEVVLPDVPASGVLLSQGGYLGGWSFYADGGHLKYAYNFLGLSMSIIASETPLPAGKHQLRAEFVYDGGGMARGGVLTLYVDGAPVGSGRIEATQPIVYSADETSDVGRSLGTPVSTEPGAAASFNGSIDWVRIDLGDDDHSHLIPVEDAVRSALGRQ